MFQASSNSHTVYKQTPFKLLKPFSFFLIPLVFVISYSSAQAEILFLARTIGPSTNIYSSDEAGKITKITDNQAWIDAQMRYAPSGEIVFISSRKDKVKIDLNKQREIFNIFKTSVNDHKPEQLSSTPEFEHSPAISNSGLWTTWVKRKNKSNEIMLLKRGEKTPKPVAIARSVSSMDWSPDGKTLCFSILKNNFSQVYFYKPETGKSQRVINLPINIEKETKPAKESPEAKFNKLLEKYTYSDGSILSSVNWSPDGSKLAVILGSDIQKQRKLLVIDLDDNQVFPLSISKNQVQAPVSWSTDSKEILYSALLGYNYYFDEKTQKKVYEGSMQIFRATLNGKIEQLTKGEHLHNRPTFSPDGKKIAFLYGEKLSDRSLALVTLDLQTKERRELFDRAAGDSFLYWYK